MIMVFINDGEKNGVLPLSKSANLLMNAKGFINYVMHNGYHFTNELATKACNDMSSKHNNVHPWSWKEVEDAIKPMVESTQNTNRFTIGDYTYMANMYLMDFYPNVIKEKTDCLKMAIEMAEDIDGYEGIAMMRWISDLVGKKIVDYDWAE